MLTMGIFLVALQAMGSQHLNSFATNQAVPEISSHSLKKHLMCIYSCMESVGSQAFLARVSEIFFTLVFSQCFFLQATEMVAAMEVATVVEMVGSDLDDHGHLCFAL